MTIIEQIKAEIERLKAKYRKDMYKSSHEGLASGYKIEAYNELLSFLDSLESEKPMNQKELEREIERCLWKLSDDPSNEELRMFARNFYDLGCRYTAEKYDEIEYNRQRVEESVPKDLEEYASRAGFDYVDNIVQEHPGHRFNDHDVEFAYRDGIIAGAKWHADHTPLPEDTVLFNKGVEEGKRLAEEEQADLFTIVALDAAQRAKEQMLKEAVEGEVESFTDMQSPEVTIPLNPTMFKVGDKIRVIIVKE